MLNFANSKANKENVLRHYISSFISNQSVVSIHVNLGTMEIINIVIEILQIIIGPKFTPMALKMPI